MIAVVPLAGTWIETRYYQYPVSSAAGSFPLRERGLKLVHQQKRRKPQSRSPCGNVD